MDGRSEGIVYYDYEGLKALKSVFTYPLAYRLFYNLVSFFISIAFIVHLQVLH